jgi:hypothetical protein
MDLYEEHKDHRDKFEVLAFHDASAKDFDDLDKKCEGPSKLYWHGKKLPFPILLDATGKTIQGYGVHAFPTTLLIDPDGKLVGEASEEQLEAKLPELPIEKVIGRLDKNVTFSFNDTPLGQTIATLSKLTHVPIRLDEAALKSAGVTAQTPVPYKMSGVISLRSALDLLLCAYDLGVDKDPKGLVIVHRKKGIGPTTEGSEPQRFCAERINALLDKPMAFDVKDKTLNEVTDYFEQATRESFVLDPASRQAKLLDPVAKVTGSAGKDEPLRKALVRLLEPLGLKVVVRDEVVIFTSKSLPD